MVGSDWRAAGVLSGNRNNRCMMWIWGLMAMLLLAGCDNAASPEHNASAATSTGWPRTVQTLKGPVTLAHPPQRIVSTSVTISGTLLAINAPLIGSGATSPNTTVADDQGFFRQWSAEASNRSTSPNRTRKPSPPPRRT